MSDQGGDSDFDYYDFNGALEEVEIELYDSEAWHETRMNNLIPYLSIAYSYATQHDGVPLMSMEHPTHSTEAEDADE